MEKRYDRLDKNKTKLVPIPLLSTKMRVVNGNVISIVKDVIPTPVEFIEGGKKDGKRTR